MKLTEKQKDALLLLNEEKSISTNKLHKNTMNSLYFKGLVRLPIYANGDFWELTDKGYEEIEKIIKNE